MEKPQTSDLGAQLLDKYGPTMTLRQFGDVIRKPVTTLHSDMSRGLFPVPTYKVGNRHILATLDVVAYMHSCRVEHECSNA